MYNEQSQCVCIYIYLKLDIQKVMLGRYELECELKKKKKKRWWWENLFSNVSVMRPEAKGDVIKSCLRLIRSSTRRYIWLF